MTPPSPLEIKKEEKRRQNEEENPPETSLALSTNLLNKCRRLLAELDAFQSQLQKTLRNPQLVEIRQLRSSVVSELRALEKLAGQVVESSSSSSSTSGTGADDTGTGTSTITTANEAESRLVHALRSSNLPFYEAVWTIAKRSCTGLVAFGKRFYWDDGDSGSGTSVSSTMGGKGEEEGEADGGGAKKKKKEKKRAGKDKRKSVFVDIVADDGEEWVKVSTISETRLLFEMAKKGWERDDDTDFSSGEEYERGDRTVLRNTEDEDDDEGEIELIKLAREMRKASAATRVGYRHPRVRFVIPKVEEGRAADIDDILNEIRANGITVECGESTTDATTELESQVPADELDLSHLLPKPFKRFTFTLNVDCTLLLALVSDLSHSKSIAPLPSHHKAIVRQIEIERQQPLLPAELWPAMDGYELICTEEAARRMREIVDIIGTDTEKKRTEILMGDPPFATCDRDAALGKFQELSDYQVPAQWRIPIRVVETKTVIDMGWKQGRLPPIAHKVAEILSDINYSVFLYGWATGLMTISSNRTVVRQIEATVEKHRDGDDNLEGPLVWVCDTARSLIGKEKDRK